MVSGSQEKLGNLGIGQQHANDRLSEGRKKEGTFMYEGHFVSHNPENIDLQESFLGRGMVKSGNHSEVYKRRSPERIQKLASLEGVGNGRILLLIFNLD